MVRKHNVFRHQYKSFEDTVLSKLGRSAYNDISTNSLMFDVADHYNVTEAVSRIPGGPNALWLVRPLFRWASLVYGEVSVQWRCVGVKLRKLVIAQG